jgi:hypothetical protein
MDSDPTEIIIITTIILFAAVILYQSHLPGVLH